MNKFLTTFLFLALFQSLALTQTRKPKPVVKDNTSSEAFIQMIEQTLTAYYEDYAKDPDFDSIINILEYEAMEIPDVSDDVICKRLEKMNELSPFHLDCNPTTLSVIRFFNKSRRSFISICLGRSKLYFEMYEQILDKHDLPIDLRFLSVIESGLRPQVKSPAGALGLWQFMYGTGKMYGLKENSFFDERMDPMKSTEAACKYLKKLHDIYGDWNLALAAYNAGPGNINKAIRRSGGKKTYWEVRPFLPRETQGYVPNFIAAAYLMTYHIEHNIFPAETKIHYAQLDTMCFSRGVHMETMARLVDWPLEDIKKLNPIYKRTYIPATVPNQCISGPLKKIGKLVSLQDTLYQIEKNIYQIPLPVAPTLSNPIIDTLSQPDDSLVAKNKEPKFINHKVKKGETLTRISIKYNVKTSQIIEWNNLRSAHVPAGKVLKIGVNDEVIALDKRPDYVPPSEKPAPVISEEKEKVINSVYKDLIKEKKKAEIAKVEKGEVLKPAPQKTSKTAPIITQMPDSVSGLVYYDTVVSVNHFVQRNESLDVIAGLYKVNASDIKVWNKLKDNWLNVGQKLYILTKVKMTKPGMVVNQEKIDLINVKTKSQARKFHTVQSGDLFNRIAQKYGLTVEQLRDLNPGVDTDKISVGLRLRVK